MKAIQSWKVLLFVLSLLVLVGSLNFIVRRLTPVRLDTTSGQVYTLSKGTREIIKKARDSGRPVTVRLYVSDEDVEIPKALREYAKRVEDLLEEYAKLSGNSIVVQSYQPVPNSVEEDAAILDGVTPRDPIMDLQQTDNLDDIDFNRRGLARQPYFFGLSVTSLDRIETIPFLDPKQEANLEYQLSRAITAVTRSAKMKIGLLEGSDISMGGSPAMMGGRGTPPWTLYRYLEKDYDIVQIPFDVQPMEPGDDSHPFADLDLLLIVHPVRVNYPQSPQPGMPPMGTTTVDNLSTEAQYAIDQYLLRGGKVLAFVDNQYMVSRYFDPYSTVLPFQRRDDNPTWLKDLMNLFDSQGLPSYRSGLDELYKAWGVRVGDASGDAPVLVDPKLSRPVAYPRPVQNILQREFRLVNQLRQIPDQRWTQAVVQSMEQGAALMADFSGDALTDHPATRNLSSVRMVDPSPIEGKPAAGLSMRTLVKASSDAKALPGEQVGFLLGVSRTLEEAMAQLQGARAKESPYPVAVLLEGTFKSAFESDPTKAAEEEIPPAPPSPAPSITPPLLPEDAPDSIPATPVAPAPGGEESSPEEPAGQEAPAGDDAPAPGTETDPGEAGEEAQPGEPAEGEFPNPQNPDESAEAAPEASPAEAEAAPEAEVAPETPSAEEPAPAEGAEGTEEASSEPAEAEVEEEPDHHLSVGTAPGSVILVSDVDMLFDFFLGDPNSRGGQRSHDNLAFVFNLIETLVGDQDLMEIRGRGSSDRPFKVIDEIRAEAAEKQSARRAEIQKKMEDANKALMEGQLVLTQEGELQVQMDAERAEKLELARAEIRELEQEQRLINREERKEIQAEISRYKWSNMLITPVLVIVIGFLVGLLRKVKTAAK